MSSSLTNLWKEDVTLAGISYNFHFRQFLEVFCCAESSFAQDQVITAVMRVNTITSPVLIHIDYGSLFAINANCRIARHNTALAETSSAWQPGECLSGPQCMAPGGSLSNLLGGRQSRQLWALDFGNCRGNDSMCTGTGRPADTLQWDQRGRLLFFFFFLIQTKWAMWQWVMGVKIAWVYRIPLSMQLWKEKQSG